MASSHFISLEILYYCRGRDWWGPPVAARCLALNGDEDAARLPPFRWKTMGEATLICHWPAAPARLSWISPDLTVEMGFWGKMMDERWEGLDRIREDGFCKPCWRSMSALLRRMLPPIVLVTTLSGGGPRLDLFVRS
ncbi:hypothetical protein ACLOJK_008549 [Asimina triloba]